MINFDPSRIEAKCEGRRILADVAGIALEDAAVYFSLATHQNFQLSFNAFVKAFPEAAKKISDHRPDGVGPGEMLAWFIFDNLTLGGKNASMDLMVDGLPFAEVKGGKITQKSNTLDNFKLSKDGDEAVVTILNDLVRFNKTYKQIMGSDLPGWSGAASVKVTALATWMSFDLMVLRKIAPPPSVRRYLPIDPDGSILSIEEDAVISSLDAEDFQTKVKHELSKPRLVEVDKSISTMEKIIAQWRNLVICDYVQDKNFVLLDTVSMEVKHFGPINEKAIGLYCMHRNQPWARIHLDKL